MIILETKRLRIREFERSDAAFILELLNEPAWIKFIGDKKVHNLEDAREFIENILRPSYKKNGFGLFLAQLKNTKEPVGMSGLVNRPGLNDIDIGFSILARHRRNGYAFESSKAMLAYAKNTLKIKKVVAITHIENTASGRLLEKLGLSFDSVIDLSEDGKDLCNLFVPK
jgi:RimJ/RimL family protein N-acetyltransferase